MIDDPFLDAWHRQLRGVHRQVRDTIAERDTEAINWVPAPGTNSAAVLVVHTLGSEAEVLDVVRGIANARDRASEFQVDALSAGDLLALLDAADGRLEEFAASVTADDLRAERERPAAAGRLGARAGSFWLVNAYGHAREHLGHLQLTLQIFDRRVS